MALKTEIGSATAIVVWNLDTNEPELKFEIDLEDSGFPQDAALAALSAASRRMADEIDQAKAAQKEES